MNHLQKNKLLSNRQYGFIGGRSTALQMLKVMDDWTDILDRGGQLDVIYLYFMKAFDTVPHKRLLNKISSYGIDKQTLGWTKALLTEIQQRVSVNGAYSTWMDVISGIPQGSIYSHVVSLPDLSLI